MSTTDSTTGFVTHTSADVISPIHTYVNDVVNPINDYALIRRQKTYSWANAAARTAQTGMAANDNGYQVDTDTKYRYSGSAWVVWEKPVATWSPTYSNITVGNGTAVAKYSQSGGWTFLDWELTLGSTSSIAGGTVISLPTTLSSDYPVGSGLSQNAGIYDLSATTPYPMMVNVVSTTTVQLGVPNAAGTYAVRAGITGSVPITFATGDVLNFFAMYRNT